jgi:hypothetical protein
MHRFGVLALLAVIAWAQAAERAPLESEKIQYLIASIETLTDAQFIRNGIAYSPRAAADHLRLKLKYAGSNVSSAADFIRLCASASSVTGKPYEIRFSTGRVMNVDEYLRQKLGEFRERP